MSKKNAFLAGYFSVYSPSSSSAMRLRKRARAMQKCRAKDPFVRDQKKISADFAAVIAQWLRSVGQNSEACEILESLNCSALLENTAKHKGVM